jgi:antirestriction protein
MRAGDLVRFKYTWSDHEGWKVGLLKEYHTWEKVATIIYDRGEVRVAAALTQLYKRAKRK